MTIAELLYNVAIRQTVEIYRGNTVILKGTTKEILHYLNSYECSYEIDQMIVSCVLVNDNILLIRVESQF